LAACRSAYSPSSYPELLLLTAVLGVFVLIGWWFWGFDAVDKRRFLQMVRRG
jgi:hypothetical protein